MKKFTLILLLGVAPVSGHDWYPHECCAEHDCHPVPCSDILTESGGGFVYKGPWSHGIAMHFTRQMNRSPAPDGLCHVCINSATTIPGPMCIYLGGGT